MKQKIEFPCLAVKMVPRASVVANNYNPNHVPRDKMELLKQSILDNGFCYPIVTIWDEEDEKYVIIDGFHRYTICAPEWLDIDPVPVVVLPHNLAQRMAATVQFNKARGVHEVDLDADIVKSLLQQGMSELDVAKHLGLDIDTVYRYKQVSGVLELFANVDYSTSWEAVPEEKAVRPAPSAAESPAKAEVTEIDGEAALQWLKAHNAGLDGIFVRPHGRWYAAVEGGETCGVCGLDDKDGKHVVGSAWVLPEKRRRGLFGAMLAKMLATDPEGAWEAHARPMSLGTFKRFGFAEGRKFGNGTVHVSRAGAEPPGKWEYGGAYKRHDMGGVIRAGTGQVQVWDLFDGVPEFMLGADCVFVDPPCSTGNLRSFYTKADRPESRGTYEEFLAALFAAIDAIGPKWLYVEAFKSNLAAVESACRARFADVAVDESSYYHREKNRCWIVRCGGAPAPGKKLDEEDYIAWVCANAPFSRIADPCMGRGLVGYHAHLAGKPFSGTELNPKRLAVLLDRISRKCL